MYDVLKNHDVRLQESWDGHPTWRGDEDIIISTFAYTDLPDYKGDKPLIIYATDPVPHFVKDDFIRLQSEKWVTMVLAENCYPQEICPIIKPFTEIPFAIRQDRLAPYTGEINKVLVVNRKPERRWEEVSRGATGLAVPFDELFKDIPYEISRFEPIEEYYDKLGKYKVMFYFSNSPYTIVMFEGMTIGMPMVGYNHFHTSSSSPIEKYLPNYEIDIDKIREMCYNELNKPAEKVAYNIPAFDETVNQWDKIIAESINNYAILRTS
jgi:hypothetical protein